MLQQFGTDALGHAGFEQYALEIGGQILEDVGGEEVDQVRRDARGGKRARPAGAAAHREADALKGGGPAIGRGLIAVHFGIGDVAKLAEEFRGLVGAKAQALDVDDDGLFAQLKPRKIDRRDLTRADAALSAGGQHTDQLRDHGFRAGLRRLFEIVDDDDDVLLHGANAAQEILDRRGRGFGQGDDRLAVGDRSRDRLAEKAEERGRVGIMRFEMKPGDAGALPLPPGAVLPQQRRLAEAGGRLRDDEADAGVIFQAIDLVLAQHDVVGGGRAGQRLRE